MLLTETSELSPAPQPAPIYVVRAPLPTDYNFVARAWIDAFRYSSNRLKRVEPTLFNNFCHKVVRRILQRAEVRVAAPPDDPLTVYGFAVLELARNPPLIHMTFVRKAWRRMGIATALLSGVDINACHWTTVTSDMDAWIRNKWDIEEKHTPFWMDLYGHLETKK